MIPKNQWWCGCNPDIKFDNEDDFKKHMKGKKHNWDESYFIKLTDGGKNA